MFKYDDVYNLLFENEEFVEILCKFHTSNWEKLEKKEKDTVIKSFIDKYCEILKIDHMKFKKGQSNFAGSYIDIGGSIAINWENNPNQYDALDTLFHELRHNFQHRAVSKNLTELETVDEELVKAWKLNFLRSPRGYSNYISADGEDRGLYAYQPVEKDAFMTGLSLTKKSYDVIRGILGDDNAYVAYAQDQKLQVMLYFSQEENYLLNMKVATEKVYEIFAKNNKEKELEKECLKIAKETMKTDIKDMSIDQIISLFSVYVWSYLDDDYKLDLLKEYDRRVNKYRPIKMEMDGNSAFKVAGKVCSRNQIVDILNTLFTYQFENVVKAMIKGIETCDEELREELALNMYKDGSKRINYVRDSDNFLLYSIQPYAVLEGKVVIEWLKKIRDVEIATYSIDTGHYDDMIDYYDYDKYIKFIEGFYDKPFDEIYKETVEQMRENVKKITRR